MSLKSVFFVAIYSFLTYNFCVEAQNILTANIDLPKVDSVLLPINQFKPYPQKTDRKVWDEIAPEVKQHFIDKANNLQNFEWRGLPATIMLEFVRTGNRTNFEKISFDKRKALVTFAIAELIENKGRFIDNIVDGVWSVCEESYWGLPAHLKHSNAGEGLVDNTEPFVDLFSAETARTLALINYFFKADFQKISPQISKRINAEIKQRVLNPALQQKIFWMNVSNNWNTWISAGWLTAALLEESDPALRSKAVFKIMGNLDNFLRNYPEDGGCDEGPAYWNAAGGSLYENLYMLEKASNKKLSYWQNSKIRNIGEYITKVRLTQNYITNFADAPAQSKAASSWVFFCGEMIQNDDMIRYGAGGFNYDLADDNFYHFNRLLELVLNFERVKKIQPQMPFYKNTWLNRIQVMVARDTEKTDQGFVLVAKGGTNTESHNHNDVGSFMVYYNGFPVLIDVGNGTYTARTFSKDRYKIWSNASDYHNIPTVGGVNQYSARGTMAKNVKFQAGDRVTSFAAELQQAYPDSAGVIRFERKLKLERHKQVVLSDYIQTKQKAEIIFNFMTCVLPQFDNNGSIIIQAGDQKINMTYDPKKYKVVCEKMKLDLPEDKGIKEKWNEVYRIDLISRALSSDCKFSMIISQID